MNRQLSRVLKSLALAAAVAAPLAAHAESNFVTAGPFNTTARVDFRITIPQVLFLQVGTGTLFANNAAIDLVDFVVPAATLGDGNPVAATAASGDIGNGTLTAMVRGNGGNVTLAASTVGALSNGAGNFINWNEITTNLTAGTLPVIPVPNGATASNVLNAVAGVVNQSAQWTYSYDNTAIVAAGTYGGIVANNSRVTYTATMP